MPPNGRPFTQANIGNALAGRELSRHLRELDTGGSGPPPFSKADRSRFLSALDAARTGSAAGLNQSEPQPER